MPPLDGEQTREERMRRKRGRKRGDRIDVIRLCAFGGDRRGHEIARYGNDAGARQPRKPRQRTRQLTPGMRAGFENRAWEVLRDCEYETLPSRPRSAGFEEVRNLARRAFKSVKRRVARG